MYHFYTERSNISETRIKLTGEDVNHIKNVLRMKPGEELIICDGEGTDHYCRIASFDAGCVTADILESFGSKAELSTRLYLFQGMPKKDKMEMIIQKAVELGVYEIVPVMTKRVIVKLDDEKKEARKLERWQAIAESAAKQSGRGIIPKIHPVMSYKDAVSYASELDANLIPYENADSSECGMESSRAVIGGLRGKRSAGIFIGPEGGFEESEIEQAVRAGFKCISLGRRILRTETAGLAVLSVIMFELD
ncbi:MAG: 16S rRNA (uracil(1498)-N(3))-methyltransferase [Lachnospiraceae bacterium]|nr:16S rRNA (uracil(1498)-N(3))-methyltransferase [Lachnospiraceae bacterium]